MRFRLLYFCIALLSASAASAQTYTLEQCRQMARQNNKELRQATAKQQAAYWQRKSAFTNYLPKVSATGGYMFTSREISLLTDEQKTTLPHLGDGMAQQLAAMGQGQLGMLLQQPLNGVGQKLVDALDTDTRNAAAIAFQLTQPLYMGGKIKAYNNIARLAEQAAGEQYSIAEQNLLTEVDETYWQIVALKAKQELAQSYLALTEALDKDVDAMIQEGVATRADGLSVKVKVTQARTATIQVANGLTILRMLLCQLCGLDVNTPIQLADESLLDNLPTDLDQYKADGDAWRSQRPELQALNTVVSIGQEKVKVARSEFLPSVALTGGYTLLTPGLFNGFEKKMTGLWNVGVAVNIPIVTWGDRKYKVEMAKAQVEADRYRLEETTEKVELQVAQSRQRVAESSQRMEAAQRNREAADENLRMATLGMKEGVIPVLNVNEAQTAWLSARTELISTQIDLKLAHIHLRKALGLTN